MQPWPNDTVNEIHSKNQISNNFLLSFLQAYRTKTSPTLLKSRDQFETGNEHSPQVENINEP